jgi:hypothetical protein
MHNHNREWRVLFNVIAIQQQPSLLPVTTRADFATTLELLAEHVHAESGVFGMAIHSR